MVDLTPLMTAAIAVLAATCTVFVTVKLVPEVRKLLKPLQDAYPKETAFLKAQLVTAIKGAEKEFGSGEGALKRSEVLIYVQKQAERYGYKFDEFVVKTMLHAELKELEDNAAAALEGKN